MLKKTYELKVYSYIILLSVIILTALFWLIYFKSSDGVIPSWIYNLPLLNAILNSLSTLCLISGYVAIKKQYKTVHISFMASALLFSILFLISYVIYHYYYGHTKFLETGLIRYIYFTILISHILLTFAVVPMVFTTLFFAITKNMQKHKAIAIWTLPLWLYVSITGVLIYVIQRW